MLYDIDYDDGDKEEEVIAGRVRSPGQSAPTLEVGMAVDVKLARKGKVRQLNKEVLTFGGYVERTSRGEMWRNLGWRQGAHKVEN